MHDLIRLYGGPDSEPLHRAVLARVILRATGRDG